MSKRAQEKCLRSFAEGIEARSDVSCGKILVMIRGGREKTRVLSRVRRVGLSKYAWWVIATAAVFASITWLVNFGFAYQYQQSLELLPEKTLLSPGLCMPFEVYDAKEFACVAQCSADTCERLEKHYSRMLDILSIQDLKYYFAFEESSFSDAFGSSAETRFFAPVDPNSVSNRSFAVNRGVLGQEIARVGNPTLGKSAAALWDMFAIALPREVLPYVEEFLLLHDTNLSLPTAAWVAPLSATSSAWQVAFNEGAYISPKGYLIDRGSVIHTVIHEIGHLITLNAAEIDALSAPPECKTILLREGCAREGSYMDKFVKEFWPEQYGKEEAPLGQFVEGAYVSGYAADNPSEDIAETWAAFVLLPKPVGNAIVDRKILFFYRYPELVKTRSIIRERIGEFR